MSGVIKPVGIDELLATIPPKCTTDKLVKTFFDKQDSPIPTFRWFPISLVQMKFLTFRRRLARAYIHAAIREALGRPFKNKHDVDWSILLDTQSHDAFVSSQ